MKERPILFSAPMVRALLAGTKTQTRRIVKEQPPKETEEVSPYYHPSERTHLYAWGKDGMLDWDKPCPYGEIGDRLYVRETWQHSNWPSGPYDDRCFIFYRADYLNDPHGPDGELSPEGKYRTWRPSIHMPRAASRILLEVVSVRVERLQDISEPDARAEGITDGGCASCGHPEPCGCGNPSPDARDAFIWLWESINGGGSWPLNPWVWVVEFRRIAS